MMTSGRSRNGGSPVVPGLMSIFCAVDFPANQSPWLDGNSARPTSGGSGRNWPTEFGRFDRDTYSWKTSPQSGRVAGKSGKTWPRAGMTCNGIAYQLPPSAPRTNGTGGSVLPTPRATDGERGGRGDLLHYLRHGQKDSRRKTWPTPTARDWRGSGWSGPGRPLSETVGGSLNPTWVEWLMGFPAGWTELED